MIYKDKITKNIYLLRINSRFTSSLVTEIDPHNGLLNAIVGKEKTNKTHSDLYLVRIEILRPSPRRLTPSLSTIHEFVYTLKDPQTSSFLTQAFVLNF